MNVQIYVNVENKEKFAAEPNKSGLVNELLAEHYKKVSASQTPAS